MTTTEDICSPGYAQVWIYMAAYPDAGDAVQLIWGDETFSGGQPDSNYLYLNIDSAGALALIIEGSTGAAPDSQVPPGTFPLSTWVDFTYEIDCATGSGSIFSAEMDTGVSADDNPLAVPLTVFTVRETGPDAGHTFYIDDVLWDNGATAAVADRFCANPSESNFGYDYVEDVEFVEDIFVAAISLEDAFKFSGNSGDSQYLAKGYNPGSEAFLVRARIEADTELESSKFRIAFTTGATVLTLGSGQDTGPSGTDFIASSDGEDGGNFDDHIQIILVENSNSWGISAWYNVGGTGLTQIPGTVNYGANPNSATTFQIVVNSGTTDLPTSVDNHTIPDIGDQVISVQDGDGNIIFQWQLPAGLFNAEWKDQWFIGKGVNAGTAFTYLDDTDQLQDDDSTCLWDLLGTGTRTGSAGLAPGSTIMDPPEDGEGGGFSDLFGGIVANTFMGFLLVFGVVWMGVERGVIGGGLTALFLIGIGLGYAIGWIDLWLVLVLFVVSLAAVWFLPKPSGDGV